MNPNTVSSISLDFTIRYVEGLTISKKLARKNLFVNISTEEHVYGGTQLRTAMCEEGEIIPTWNEKLTMAVASDTKAVLLEVWRKTSLSSEKSIATARVPISDFVGTGMPQDYKHFLSYRLRDHHGEPNGIINFCVSVKRMVGSQYGQTYRQGCHAESSQIHGFGYQQGSSQIHGYGSRQSYVPNPWNAAPAIGNPRNLGPAAVGVPAMWYNSWQQ